MRIYKKILLLLTLQAVFVLILDSNAHAALSFEYYTYGSFNEVVKAFQKAALIFSDSNYQTLFSSVIILAVLFIGGSAFFGGGSERAGIGLVSAFVGIVLFSALILPKGTVHVYDPVKNRYQAVGDVPDGLVAVAGLTNLIERTMIDIITTSGDPIGYKAQAGGIGFDFLYNVHSKGILLADEYIHRNLSEYTKNCLFFELLRPGTTLSANEIAKNNNFQAVFAKAASPAIYTQIYRDEDGWREGQSQTCQSAWASINIQLLNNTNYETGTKARCADIGFDPTIPDEMTQCRTMIADFTSWFEGAAWEQVGFFRQTLLAQNYYDSLIAISPDVAMAQMAARNTGTGFLASSMAANQMIPTIRGILIGVAILLTPFLVIFFPTQLVWKAASLIVGLFFWIMSWGVIDALLHSYAMDRSYQIFEEVRTYQLGADAVAMFGTSSLKALAFFGTVRWGGLLLATVITGMIIKYGGHALAQLGGNLTSPVQAEGVKAGMQTQTPEGTGHTMNSMVSGATALDFAGGSKWSQRLEAAKNQMANSVGSGLGMGDMGSAQKFGENSVGQNMAVVEGKEIATGGNKNIIKDLTSASTASDIGKRNQALMQAKEGLGIKGSPEQVFQKLGAFAASGYVPTDEMRDYIKSTKGISLEKGSQITSSGFNEKGELTSLTAKKSDGSGGVEFKNGFVTSSKPVKDSHGNTLKGEKVTDTTGKTISSSAAGQTMESYSLKGHDGKSFEIKKGAEVKTFFDSNGNMVRAEYAGITGEGKNAKKGTISVDSSGKAVWTSMDGGHQTNLKDIDNKTKEKMNRSNWGSEAISHNEAKHVGSFWEKDSVSGKLKRVYGEQDFGLDENNKLVHIGGKSNSGTDVSQMVKWTDENGHVHHGMFQGKTNPKTGEILDGKFSNVTTTESIKVGDQGSFYTVKKGTGGPGQSVAHEKNMSGQEVSILKTFIADYRRSYNTNLGNSITKDGDLTNMSDSAMNALIVGGSVEATGSVIGNILQLSPTRVTKGIGSGPKPPAVSTGNIQQLGLPLK